MTLPRRSKAVLLVDDEPYHLQWAMDYLESQTYEVEVAESAEAGVEKLTQWRYRMVIVDLSIPGLRLDPGLVGDETLLKRYPGLIVATYARNHGHTGRQVIVYSVHDDPEVQSYCKRIMTTYLLKGRPRQFKLELDSVLEYDPFE